MLDPKYLNKWTAERIDDVNEEELYTVTYFVQTAEGVAAFYFMEFENPPTVGFTKTVFEDAPSKTEILDRKSKWHPLNHVSEDLLRHAMARAVFEEDVDVR